MGVYLADDNMLGFAFDGTSSWTQFGSVPPGGTSTLLSLRALASAPDHDDCVYAAPNTGTGPRNEIYASTDAGATWVKRSVTPIPPTTTGGPVGFLECRAVGEVYVCAAFTLSSVAHFQIIRSVDDGVTWTTIFDTATQMGFIALGSGTLWFAHQLDPAGPVAYRQINVDGSGLVTRATQSVFPSAIPQVHLVAAIDDTFAIFVSWAGPSVYHVTASGTLTDIRPSGLVKPWDVAIVNSTTYVAVGQSGSWVTSNPPTSDPMSIYRTTNSGASWSLVLSVPAADSFLNSFARPDNARIIDVEGEVSTLWLLGADINRQQTIMRSTDAGLTWTTITNPLAIEVDGSWFTSQNSLRAGRRTVPITTAVPSRLATIVG